MTSDDLDLLQEIYEAAAESISTIDDATMHEAVKMLIAQYQIGERDKDKLISIAMRGLQRAVG